MSGSCAYQIDPAQQSKDCPTITTSTSNVLYNHMQLIPFSHWPKFVQFRFVLLYKQTVQHASYIQTRMHTINLRWREILCQLIRRTVHFKSYINPQQAVLFLFLPAGQRRYSKTKTILTYEIDCDRGFCRLKISVSRSFRDPCLKQLSSNCQPLHSCAVPSHSTDTRT